MNVFDDEFMAAAFGNSIRPTGLACLTEPEARPRPVRAPRPRQLRPTARRAGRMVQLDELLAG